ncbi:MAG: type II secretion system protein GspM [Candidatus Binatia bacterium]|nr:type II secretion system protein GspM [Candidatus Binatia bacterium]
MIERLLAGPRAQVTEFLAGLQPRERSMLYGAMGVAAVLILWLGVYEPMTNTLTDLDRKIAIAQRDAASINALAERYRTLRHAVADLEGGGDGSNGGASLFSQLESTTVPIVGRERIVSMNPSSRQIGENFEEDLVDMRLEAVPLREVIELLYTIEYKDPPMRLSRAAFKREYKDPSLIDATLVVARLSPR